MPNPLNGKLLEGNAERGAHAHWTYRINLNWRVSSPIFGAGEVICENPKLADPLKAASPWFLLL